MRISAVLVALAFAAQLSAAVDGTVINKSTGQAAASIPVSLIRPGQNGMKPVGSTTTDADGRFHFEENSPAAGPQLLQANYGGINYNKLLTPNMPTSGVELNVYEATQSAAAVRVVQRMLIFEPNSSQVALNETVILQNDSNTTFHDRQNGDFRFYLPPAANGQVRVSAQGPGGMPLPRPAEKAEGNLFKLDFPIKPGETQLEINYNLPVGSPMQFHGQVVNIKDMQAGPLRLVAPQGVKLGGSDIQEVGTEPKTQATIYNVTARDLFTVDVSGTGSLRAASDATAPDEGESPQISEGQPQIYAHMRWLVALTFAILGVGLVYLFRSSPDSSISGN